MNGDDEGKETCVHYASVNKFYSQFFAWNQWNDFFSLLLLFIFFEGKERKKEENVLDRCWTRYRSHVHEKFINWIAIEMSCNEKRKEKEKGISESY